MKKKVIGLFLAALFLLTINSYGEKITNENAADRAMMNTMQSITSKEMYTFVEELSNPKYNGRLSGSPGYMKAAQWVADKLKSWNVKPCGEKGIYFQYFDQPYTDVQDKGKLILTINGKDDSKLQKQYVFEDEYYPGANSDSGKVSADVVYIGYGVSAPELGYDDYADVDVKGKIVLFDAGIPFKDTKNIETYVKWVKYQSPKVKYKIAKEHGALGVIRVGRLVTSPHTDFVKGLLACRVGEPVANDLFFNTGKNHKELSKEISKNMKPASFDTGKEMTIECNTVYHSEGKSCNVIGVIEGTDPKLKYEYILIGTHLDAAGNPGAIMPGAFDNGSGVVQVMEMAKALANSPVKNKRSIVVLFFGGEECGLCGSDYYCNNPTVPKNKVIAYFNIDMVGIGSGIEIGEMANYPNIVKAFDEANKFVHRPLRYTDTAPKYYGPAQVDQDIFKRAGYPRAFYITNFFQKGEKRTKYYYHQTKDTVETINVELMQDISRLFYLGLTNMANDVNILQK